MNNNKISNIEYGAMIVIQVLSTFLGVGIYSVINLGKVNAYLSPIITLIISIPVIFMYLKILNYEKDLPINKKLTKLFGKIPGNIINTIIVIVAEIVNITVCYNLIIFITSQFLTKTPAALIGIVFSILIIYLNSKGLDTIARIGFIIAIICAFLIIIAWLGLIPNIDINNLKPFLKSDITGIFSGGFRILLYNILSIFVLLIIPKNNIKNNDKTNKTVIISYIIAIILMISILFFIISVLGINLASYYEFPEYVVLKSINILDFINRIENVVVIQWILELFFTGNIMVYYLKKNLSPNKNYKFIPYLIAFPTVLTSTFLFKNNTIFNFFTFNILPIIRSITLILLVIISLAIIIKTKKE